MKRNLKISGALLVIIVVVLAYTFRGSIFPRAATPIGLKVAFMGDQGHNENSIAVLNLIKSERAEAVFNQGDFDYADDPTGWDDLISSILGKDFPYFSTIGNHDEKEWATYQKKIKERMARVKDAVCTGDIGVKSTCLYKGLSYISVAPGIDTHKDDYPSYLKASLSQSKTIWNICAWHKNQMLMQLGEKPDEVGWEVYETCRDSGAIIATAHEHSYSRSYVMDDITHQHVVDISDTLEIAPGKTFVFVSGLGGQSVRPQELHNSWWGGIYTENQHANYGALFCTFNVKGDAHRASCYFKDIKGNIPDKFDIIKK